MTQQTGQIEEYNRLATEKREAEKRRYGPPDNATAESSLELPDGIMTGAAGSFAKIISTYLESPPEFFYFSYLACLGNVLSDKITLDSELKVEPRLYLLLLAESSDARKSTAISKTSFFFQEAKRWGAIPDYAECHGIGSAEGLQKMLQGNGRIILIFDEFRAFTSKCSIDGSVLLPCTTTLFESKKYESHTAKKDIRIENASLSLLAASTTETYERVFDSHFLAIGFPNRLFLVPGNGQRRFSFPQKIPADDLRMLRETLGKIVQFAIDTKEISISLEAQAIFHQWYLTLPKSVHARRLETYALRFMLLLCCNEKKPVIDANITDKVIRLMNWQFEVRRRYDPVDADSNIARLEEKIRRILTGRNGNGLGKRELSRAVNANRVGLWVFAQAIENLTKAGEISFEKKSYRMAN
ncbi:MAG: hypothetical protein NTV58_06315 [Deltaproteobacteria bacterium]|nr:hypothetical protein [Deltaproteobacteria bacterium]